MGKRNIVLTPCLGIKVEYDQHLPILSYARGLGFWKRIVVGPSFYMLTQRQQGAVLLHEVGHCKHLHTERLAWHVLTHPALLLALLAAGFAAARRFRRETPQAIAWFQQDLERRAPGIAAFRQLQERQADAYAAHCGYGRELAEVFLRMGDAGGGFHPEVESRVRHVLGDSHG